MITVKKLDEDDKALIADAISDSYKGDGEYNSNELYFNIKKVIEDIINNGITGDTQ